jgi:pimeloyl-ACP methyl ester carboxylesterase
MTHCPLPLALAGHCDQIDGNAGRLALYHLGTGQPMLLLHSVNAAATSAEVQPVYDYYAARRHVFALDLPGFGLSDRSDRPYTVRLMTDSIHAAAAAIRKRCGDRPIDVLATSLSCEFVARAAVEGAAFRSLALVSPTGFSRRKATSEQEKNSGNSWAYKVLTAPGWGRLLFRALTRPRVIRYFLRRTWGSSQIDEPLWHYDVLTAEQPGAEHAPLYFLSGQLFSHDILDIYQQLTLPVWMSRGIRGDFVNYRYTACVRHLENWRHSVFATGALPYFENPAIFFQQYNGFLEHHSKRPRPTWQASTATLGVHS